jgi:hypothetical protein
MLVRCVKREDGRGEMSHVMPRLVPGIQSRKR